MNRRVGGFAHPLKGYKFSRFEGGMRVPTLMWWPGRIPAGRVCSEVGASMDFLPTCAAISGAKMPDDRVIDGEEPSSLDGGPQRSEEPAPSVLLWNGSRAERKMEIKGQGIVRSGQGYRGDPKPRRGQP